MCKEVSLNLLPCKYWEPQLFLFSWTPCYIKPYMMKLRLDVNIEMKCTTLQLGYVDKKFSVTFANMVHICKYNS